MMRLKLSIFVLSILFFDRIYARDYAACKRDRGSMNVHVIIRAPEQFDQPLDAVITTIRKQLLFPFRRKKTEYRHMTVGYFIIGDVKRDEKEIQRIGREIYKIAHTHIRQMWWPASARFQGVEIWSNYIVATFKPGWLFTHFQHKLFHLIQKKFPTAIAMYINQRMPHISLSNKFDRITARQVAIDDLIDTMIPLARQISVPPFSIDSSAADRLEVGVGDEDCAVPLFRV